MRKDISVQLMPFWGPDSLAWCIAANEEIARFHVHAEHELAHASITNAKAEDQKALEDAKMLASVKAGGMGTDMDEGMMMEGDRWGAAGGWCERGVCAGWAGAR